MIPDDVIDEYLSMLLGNSDPGDATHHLLLAAAGPDAHTPLGLLQPDKLETTMHAIMVDGSVDVDRFIAQSIAAGVIKRREDGQVVYFAGLAKETNHVAADRTKETEDLTRRLSRDRLLHEHPAAVEATVLYAACRDGRRWTGTHFLTGPQAGTVVGPTVHVGILVPGESGPHEQLVRAAVGLSIDPGRNQS